MNRRIGCRRSVFTGALLGARPSLSRGEDEDERDRVPARGDAGFVGEFGTVPSLAAETRRGARLLLGWGAWRLIPFGTG